MIDKIQTNLKENFMYLNEYFKNVIRDKSFEILGIIDSATTLSMLTFIDNDNYIDTLLKKKHISCVITNKRIGNHLLEVSDLGICISNNPRIDFFKFHNCLGKSKNYVRPYTKTVVEDSCHISSLAYIAKNNVVIGKNVIIEEFVSIKENTVIGDNCIIRAGCVIGGSGFEFKQDEKSLFAIQHFGGTILEHDVEVQYNCTIDKALYPWDNTVIGAYTKIDNLVHIGHAVKVGKNVLFPAGSTISGRVDIADNVWIGVGSVISNGIYFGENARCNIGSVVTKNVLAGESVSGNFAIEHSKFINNLKKMR